MNKRLLSAFAILSSALILADVADARRSSFRWRRLADLDHPSGWCPRHHDFRADGNTASIRIFNSSGMAAVSNFQAFSSIDMVFVVTKEVFDASKRRFGDPNGESCDIETYDPFHRDATEVSLEHFDDLSESPWLLLGSTLIERGVPRDPFGSWDPNQGFRGVELGSGSVTATLRNLIPGQEYVVGVWWIGDSLDLTVDTDHLELLENDRFVITTSWRTPKAEGNAVAVPLTEKVGLFRFRGNPEDVDLFVRLDDGCNINGFFWVQISGLTQAEATVTVTDTFTNRQLRFFNPLGTLFELRKDRRAFSCP